MSLLRSEPVKVNNFWFTPEGKLKPTSLGVLASLNNIILLDWRKLIGGQIKELGSKRYPWIVYNCTDRLYGEWHGYRTRKEAVDMFVRQAVVARRDPLCDMTQGTVVEKALRAYIQTTHSTPPQVGLPYLTPASV